MQQPPQKRGQVIKASTLASFEQRLRMLETANGWGSGQRTGGNIESAGVQFYKAQENFEAFEDVYRGDAKLWWYIPNNNAYSVHSDSITVYSHNDDVEQDDILAAVFNRQSGRWEKISSGGESCDKLVVKIWLTAAELPDGGNVTVPMTYDGNSGSPSWAYNASQSTVETAITGAISGITTSDIVVKFGQSTTNGEAIGSWPITIEWPDITLWESGGNITDTLTFPSGSIPYRLDGDICCG